MTSPNRSVVVRLALDPSSYVAGASRAEASTLSLDRAVSKVGPSSATSMEQAAKGAGNAEGALGKLNKTAGALGFTLGGLAGVGAGIAAALSVKWAGDYQQALTKLATTAGESQKNLGRVGQGMLDMAGQVGIGADELAKAMYTVDSANFHGADSLTVLKAAAQGARQEQADLSHVVDAVTTSLHDYHLPASDAANVTSQLIAAVSHGKTTFDDLTGAMHSVEPIAASAGMSIAQTAGALAAMTASGMHADQAAQNLASSIRSFEKPTGTMRDELYQLGLDAQDLSAHLGERGIAGTLQMVSEAIVNKMGPAGQVALSALNQNKAAAQDLGIMLSTMPPALAKLSQGLLDGTVSQQEFRKAAIDLGGTAGPMADQFLSLYKSSNGFSQILKTGGPAVQTYIGALGKAVGTAEGLSVALQLTGENAAATNKTIGDVANAAAQADGNIKGWSEVQGNFNQQLAQTEAHAKSLAIEAGQHLLPVLTAGLGWINSDGIPAIEHLGSAVGNAAHDFGELPAPVKDVALAFAAMKVADMLGLLDRLGSGTGRVKAAFTGFRDEMALQQSLYAAQQRSVATLGVEYGTMAERLAALTVAEDAAAASSGRLSGSMGTLAVRGMTGLKSAGSGLLSMLGGPWGVAFLGATLGVTALMDAIARHDAEIKQATADVQKWNQAIALGAGGSTAIAAQQNLDALRDKLGAVTAKIDEYNAAAARGGARGGIGSLVSQQAELRGELDKGSKAWDAQLAAMTPVEIAQARVQQDTHDLNMALKENLPNSQAVANASARLADAQSALAYQTGLANDASRTQLQRLQDLANAQLGAVSAGLAAKQSYDQFNETLTQYRSTTQHSAVETDGLAQSAISSASAAGQAGAAWAQANHVSDAAAASNYAQLLALQKVANAMGSDTPLAVSQQIAALQRAVAQGGLTAAQMDAITRSINGIPKDPRINVSADTSAAQSQIDSLIRGYQHVQYTGSSIIVNGRVIANASGNLLPMSATSASIVQPGALRVIGDNPVADEAFIPINNSARSLSILGETAARMGLGLMPMAAGGFWNIGEKFPAQPSSGWLSSIDSTLLGQIRAFVPAYNPSAGVEQWRGLVDQVLRQLGVSTSADNGVLNMIAKESGGNPRAINLWDSNARAGHPSQGLMQTIPGTFYAYAGPYAGRGITDPLANIYAGVNYALHNYGFGMLASGGRKNAFGGYMGYETGTDFVPETGPAVLHKGEAVLTKEQNEARRAIRSREFAGIGAGAMVVQHTDARSYPIAVTAGESAQAIVREVRNAQYQQDFLNG